MEVYKMKIYRDYTLDTKQKIRLFYMSVRVNEI